MIEDLEDISLFQDLSLSQLNDISEYCELQMLNDGDVLIREKVQDDLDLYVLCKGSVEIVSSSNPITSGEVVISKEDKDVFGEMAWLTKHCRTASVRCYGQVTAIRVDGHALLEPMTPVPIQPIFVVPGAIVRAICLLSFRCQIALFVRLPLSRRRGSISVGFRDVTRRVADSRP